MTVFWIIPTVMAILLLVLFYGDVEYGKGYTQGYRDCQTYHEESEMTKTIKARFEQLRQDMFWSIYDSKTDQIIRWSGYNDANWWNKVAPSGAFRVRGKYTLDPETNEVTFEESENE